MRGTLLAAGYHRRIRPLTDREPEYPIVIAHQPTILKGADGVVVLVANGLVEVRNASPSPI